MTTLLKSIRVDKSIEPCTVFENKTCTFESLHLFEECTYLRMIKITSPLSNISRIELQINGITAEIMLPKINDVVRMFRTSQIYSLPAKDVRLLAISDGPITINYNVVGPINLESPVFPTVMKPFKQTLCHLRYAMLNNTFNKRVMPKLNTPVSQITVFCSDGFNAPVLFDSTNPAQQKEYKFERRGDNKWSLRFETPISLKDGTYELFLYGESVANHTLDILCYGPNLLTFCNDNAVIRYT